MSRGVVVTPRVHKQSPVLSVALDTNFLGTPWARKVYSLNGRHKFPPTAHAHDGVEIIIPHVVSGEALLAYEVDGEVHKLQLELGHTYRVESMVPHQFSGNGQMMVEVWSPTRSLVSPSNTMVVTESDFFTQVPGPQQSEDKA